MVRKIEIKDSESGLKVNTSYEAQSLEEKIEKILSKKETIDNTAPIIYTEKGNGVQPAYNIRTDRWEVAMEATEKMNAAETAKREEAVPKPEPKPETTTETTTETK